MIPGPLWRRLLHEQLSLDQPPVDFPTYFAFSGAVDDTFTDVSSVDLFSNADD